MTQSTILEKQTMESIISSEAESTTHSKRKWIILEDNPTKSDYLILYILYYFPTDEIHLIFANKNESSQPGNLRITLDKDENPVLFLASEFLDGKYREVTGNIFFYKCDYGQFFRVFNQVTSAGKNILLMDVELISLGGENYDFLSSVGRDFLNNSSKSTITIMSRVADYTAVKEKIKPNAVEILTYGAGRWQFLFSTMLEDCREVVIESDKHWKGLYASNTFTIELFLKKMGELTRDDCHNFKNNNHAKVRELTRDGLWNKDLKMPIQLGYLVQLLDYDPVEFIQTFNMKTEDGTFKQGCPICNALKDMGTKDSYGLSFLGALLICWATYRRIFTKDKNPQNQLFIDLIMGLSGEGFTRSPYFIAPPQTHVSQKATMLSLHNMMDSLFYSSLPNADNFDNLKAITLDKTGLSFLLNVNPRKLNQALVEQYEKKLMGKKGPGGGITSQKVIDFYVKSNLGDGFSKMGKRKTFLGTFNNMKIYAATKNEEDGLILKFGNAY